MKAEITKKSGLRAGMTAVKAGARLADLVTSDGDHIKISESGVNKLSCRLTIYKGR